MMQFIGLALYFSVFCYPTVYTPSSSFLRNAIIGIIFLVLGLVGGKMLKEVS